MLLDDLTIIIAGFIFILSPLVIGSILASIFKWN